MIPEGCKLMKYLRLKRTLHIYSECEVWKLNIERMPPHTRYNTLQAGYSSIPVLEQVVADSRIPFDAQMCLPCGGRFIPLQCGRNQNSKRSTPHDEAIAVHYEYIVSLRDMGQVGQR